MAKVTSALMGTTRGSVGNVTLRRSNGQTVASQKVSDVKNPRSYAQAEQRMRMAAATTFYSPLSDVLAKAWQGKSRVESMGEFTRSAIATMRAGGYGFVKTWPTLRPYPFQVSKGSLPGVWASLVTTIWGDYDNASIDEYQTRVVSPVSWDAMTISDLYNIMTDYLGGLPLRHLQLTLIALKADTDASGVVVFNTIYGRVMLSSGDTRLVSDSMPRGFVLGESGVGSTLYFQPDFEGAAAMAVIISGHDGKKWLRSTEYLAVAPYWIDLWQSAYQVGVESFMDAAASGTAYGDVYLDGQGAREDAVSGFDWSRYVWVHPTSESGGGQAVIGSSVAAIEETMLDGVPVPGVRFADGSVYHIMGSDRMPSYNKTVNINTNSLVDVTGAGIPEGAYIKTTDTALQLEGYNEISRVVSINSALWFQS